MRKTVITFLLIFLVIFVGFKYYTKDDKGEYLKFIIKPYKTAELNAGYKKFIGIIWGAELCFRNTLEENGNNKLMNRERLIFVKKTKEGGYEGRVYLTYLKDPQKAYYIVCPAAYDLQYIDEKTEVFIDLNYKENPLEIYWAYPPIVKSSWLY